MDIPFLQKRIIERAEKKESEDFDNIIRAIKNSHIGDLRLKVWEIEIPFSYFLLSSGDDRNTWKFTSNLQELRDKKKNIYQKNETDNLLQKIETIQDFMDRRLDGFDE